jgi:hypothetical protein
MQIDDDDLKDKIERNLQARRFGRDKPLDFGYHAARTARTDV